MVEINSDDYHDFVIKDGKLIGEFEQMYQKSKEIPWNQDKQEKRLDVKVCLELLKDYKFDYIADFGSGLGYFLDILRRNLRAENCEAVGYDISQTCCKKAKQLFPDMDFYIFDLMKENNKEVGKEVKPKQKRLFVIRGTLWYVFPKMKNVVKNIADKMRQGEILLVDQNFMPLDSSFVGKEIIPNPEALINWFSEYFELIKTIWIEDKLSKGNDNWFIALFRKK